MRHFRGLVFVLVSLGLTVAASEALAKKGSKKRSQKAAVSKERSRPTVNRKKYSIRLGPSKKTRADLSGAITQGHIGREELREDFKKTAGIEDVTVETTPMVYVPPKGAPQQVVSSPSTSAPEEPKSVLPAHNPQATYLRESSVLIQDELKDIEK